MEATELTPFAETLADCAGQMAREAVLGGHTISRKADRSAVTETDKAIEAAISAMITRQFPDHGVFGEEHGRINPTSTYQWVIDPIDGTSAFIAGIPTFTTLVALCKNGVPILGIIDQPVLRERWVSTRLKPSQPDAMKLSDALLAATSVTYFTESEEKKFRHLAHHCGGTVHGGDGFLFGKLADGRIHVIAEAGLKPYDFCALAPVVQAAGGVITDWQGSAITIASNGTVLAAANIDLHRQALEILND